MVPEAPVTSSRRSSDLANPLLRAVLEGVPAPLAVVDHTGILAIANAAWRGLAGRTATFGDLGTLVTHADLVGSPYVRRLSSLEGPLALAGKRLARAIQDAIAGRAGEARVSYRARRPDGETPYEALVVPIEGARAALVSHGDLGEREHAAEAEAAAVRLGLEAEALRSRERRSARRLATVGRELHMPITPVRLELHLLQSGALGPLTDKQRHALEVVARNVQRWADGEAAFLQAPESGPREFDLATLVREAVEARQTQALKQGVSLAARIPHPLPVRASPDDVHDVLDRFLDRALEATSSGSAVDVEARPAGAEALVEVRDSGAGWSAREVKSAFEPWAGRAPRADGPGLALPYARQLAEAQGGRAWAESDGVGQGVLLGFALPLVKGRAHDSFASAGKSHESSVRTDKSAPGRRLIPPDPQPGAPGQD